VEESVIRFIDLGKQIGCDDSWPREFAFFNTVTDEFITIHLNQTWSSWKEFEDSWDCDSCFNSTYTEIDRFKSLCPEWVFENKNAEAGYGLRVEMN
jgi:hypothetical protein